jgi:hypothetical protein
MDGIIMVEEHTGSVVSVKNILPDALISCLQKGMKESKTLRSGFLPENCISYALNDRYTTVDLCIPAGYIEYTYHKTTYEHFPMPAMVFSFSLNSSGKTFKHRMAIIENGMPTSKTCLYYYPFSNVYEDCGICIGAANSLPVYKNVRALGSLPYHILSLPNNDHMFTIANNKLKLPYRDLLELLKDKESSFYYDHILIPREKTLQDFIDDKLGGVR